MSKHTNFLAALAAFRSPDDGEMDLADQFRVIADRIAEDRAANPPAPPQRHFRASIHLLVAADGQAEAMDGIAETLRGLVGGDGGFFVDWGYRRRRNSDDYTMPVEVSAAGYVPDDEGAIGALPRVRHA